jgi:hypothetical protein
MMDYDIMGRSIGIFPERSVCDAVSFDRWLNGQLSVATTFVSVDVSPTVRERFVNEHLTSLWEAGFVPILTLEPQKTGEAKEHTLPVGSNETDALYEEWANLLKRWTTAASAPPRHLYLRPAHEMNGTWYPWSVGAGVAPADFRRAWRTVYDIFDAAGFADRSVRWLWCVNAETTADVDLAVCYPGDQYVDVIGVDGYNFGSSQTWSTWTPPATIFEPAFEQIRDLTQAPLSVPEFGCSSVRDGYSDPAAKSTWISNVFRLFDKWNVRIASWFNTNKETDWRVFDRTNGDSQYPGTVQLDGTKHSVYPSFRRGAIRYLRGRYL